MKRAFSLIEVVFTITILSIIITFISSNFSTLFTNVDITKYKLQVEQIRSSLKSKKTKELLSNKMLFTSLDNAAINKENEKLFSNILATPIISSKSSWIKSTKRVYTLNLNDNKVKFEYKNNSFMCINKNNLCKEFQ
ncbi:hypothetical protein CRU98_04220 [Arcobacter sp. CECT 8986]|uniref:prepilin-type N-terminal cleavage/methylation domain-containing protein n=1 Tax=Arcobacter sp. CECT 8986 TaxID=2044507 RepID=UPI001009CF5E|nr:prepilin-type N-terminal cleavage/methylation domain-containing protein [Arcobacter sp. CECT 8986]RXK00370.1 hypothetical protein CRU98_04220 [Arcobacter sp. CECT 8986]